MPPPSPKRFPAHTLAAVLLYLTLGAVTTIALAWSCALFSSLDTPGEGSVSGSGWPGPAPAGWPEPDYFSRCRGPGISGISVYHDLARLAESHRTDPTITMQGMSHREFGLPSRRLSADILHTQNLRVFTPVSTTLLRDGLKPPPWLDRPGLGDRRIPLRPVWPGFALNTLLCASLAWSFRQVFVTARRAHRRKHNRCAACGYSLAGLGASAPCPECGSADDRRPAPASSPPR